MCVQLLLDGMFYINLLGPLLYNAVKMYWFCFCFFSVWTVSPFLKVVYCGFVLLFSFYFFLSSCCSDRNEWLHALVSSFSLVAIYFLYLGLVLLDIYIYAAAAAKSPQSCLTLCDPMDSRPPGSSVHGIL